MGVSGSVTAAVGRYGEDVAARHLCDAGLEVIERNWRCSGPGARGELDIVARDGDVLVVCEVKTRRGASCGTPLDAVTAVKAARIRRLAASWLATRDEHWPEVRFDVVGVTPAASGGAVVEHVRGAF